MYILSTNSSQKYVPIQKITTSVDSDQRQWKKYICAIENVFKHKNLPDFSAYDDLRYLKMIRSDYKYDSKTPFYDFVSYDFKLKGFKLSDHKPLIKNGIYTWNLLHHYSYNGSNDYVDKNIIKHFNYQVLTEKARYSLIATQIFESISKNECFCYSFQECEFAIYVSIVKRLNKNSYSCRFIPQRIAYDDSGLYIESYGCALIVRENNAQLNNVYVNPIQKIDHRKRESSYKYLVNVVDNVLYSSIHFPRCGRDNYSSWVNYVYQDFDIILSKLTHTVRHGFIIGDLNMREAVLYKFLETFSDYSFTVLEHYGVDYIIHVKMKI